MTNYHDIFSRLLKIAGFCRLFRTTKTQRLILLAGGFSALFFLSTKIYAGSALTSSQPESFALYSPAPENILLHDYNHQLAEAMTSCGMETTVKVVPLPDSINDISALDAAAKLTHLPVVTPVDFLPAINQTGPEWHGYSVANTDLKFIASLYDVSLGVLAFSKDIKTPEDLIGKRIAVAPIPASVRVYSDVLFRDGWGIIDKIKMIEIPPPRLKQAIEAGEVDAMAWNLMTETPTGFQPWFPWLVTMKNSHWIPITESSIKAINKANTLKVSDVFVSSYSMAGQSRKLKAPVRFLSFKQALAAWDSTKDSTVTSILKCIEDKSSSYPGLPNNPAEMLKWPALNESLLHPAALKYYKQRGADIR